MTGLLLDTHVLLWASAQPERLGPRATAVLLDDSNEIRVSAVSAAEIAIKRSLGKIEVTIPLHELLVPLGATELPLTTAHAAHTESLELIHRDPFDRLLMAQAVSEGLTFVTADRLNLRYAIDVLDARL